MHIKIGEHKVDTLVAVAVLVLVLGGVGWLGFYMGQSGEEGRVANRVDSPPPGVEEVPADTTVPEPGDDTVPENVARPTQVRSTASPTAKNRDFSVEIVGGAFQPDTVVIRQGDAGWITFTAVDGAYDVYQPNKGLSIDLQEGQTKVMAAQFSSPGKYMFYCRSCGGPEEGPVGYITVVPKE